MFSSKKLVGDSPHAPCSWIISNAKCSFAQVTNDEPDELPPSLPQYFLNRDITSYLNQDMYTCTVTNIWLINGVPLFDPPRFLIWVWSVLCTPGRTIVCSGRSLSLCMQFSGAPCYGWQSGKLQLSPCWGNDTIISCWAIISGNIPWCFQFPISWRLLCM